MIDFLISLIASICLVFGILYSFFDITGEFKKLNFKTLLAIFVGSIISVLLFYFDNSLIKNIYSLMFFTFIFKAVTKRKTIELFCYSVNMWVYVLIIDILIMLIISLFGLDKFLMSMNIIYVRAVSTILLSVLIYFVCHTTPVKKLTKKIISELLRVKLSLVIEVVFVGIVILLGAISVININKVNVILFAIIIASFLVITIIMMFERNYSINRLKEVNNVLIKNNEFFLKLDSDYRTLKHNLNSQLLGIKSVADKKTKNLIDDLLIQYNSKFIASQDIKKIPDGLNGIVYEKLYNFNKSDIKLAVENTITSNLLDVINPRNYNNLCETLGLLIDNALEATDKSEEKSILIDFSENDDYIFVKVYNTFSSTIDLDKLGNLNYSTKKKNGGIGLFSIISKNSFNIKTTIVNNLFQTDIKIRKKLI